MSKESLVFCYNKGCGVKFDPASNSDFVCQYHPGVPIFHDARKKWSCCGRGSTDFSVFLSFPGCQKGRHNPEKPPDDTPPKRQAVKTDDGDNEVIVRGPPPPPARLERPSEDEEMVRLEPNVAASLRTALESRMKQLQLNSTESENANDASTEVEKGTLCKNPGCKGKYENAGSNKEVCYYHAGAPIFHEGYKFWSCCQRKTSDFDDFLSQVGCNEGKHKWKAPKPTSAPSRWDWHQTGSFVTITLYAKCIMPDSVNVKLNRVTCSADCMYDAGLAPFQKTFVFEGIVDPSQSNVKLMGTKMEINLRKAEPCKWTRLELKQET